ncbi:NUDIX hydrolase [Desulfovibrio inopinatus]|uniref:NUDIX hydrolase n=1 Tax=Desulfovibrio inopinatus TaxID=102109 RepID=UPI0003F6A26D|nr:NUDIX domain-containing protein [Desulfovibrio inopinatus]
MKRKKYIPVEYVDVVDENDTCLAVMPLHEVHRQSLFHRSVMTLAYNAEKKLFLQKRSRSKQLYPGRWDLSSTGHVKAGESRTDAAIRELLEEIGVECDQLRPIDEVHASVDTAFEFVTLFKSKAITPQQIRLSDEVEDGMFVDRAELACMVDRFRETLTPAVVHFYMKNKLFADSGTNLHDELDRSS